MSYEMETVFDGATDNRLHFTVKEELVSFAIAGKIWSCTCRNGSFEIAKGNSGACKHIICAKQMVQNWVLV